MVDAWGRVHWRRCCGFKTFLRIAPYLAHGIASYFQVGVKVQAKVNDALVGVRSFVWVRQRCLSFPCLVRQGGTLACFPPRLPASLLPSSSYLLSSFPLLYPTLLYFFPRRRLRSWRRSSRPSCRSRGSRRAWWQRTNATRRPSSSISLAACRRLTDDDQPLMHLKASDDDLRLMMRR